MFLKIPRLYDSHAHFIATGEFAHGLRLNHVEGIESLKAIDLKTSAYFRKHFLVGFGLDLSKWKSIEPVNKTTLDSIFPQTPVCFAKNDGHGCFMNSLALHELGIISENGILEEKEHLAAWDKLPNYSNAQWDTYVQLACQVFNKSGFTHVRDLSCTEDLWSSLIRVSDAGNLTLGLEENFTVHYLKDFDQTLRLAKYTKDHSNTFVKSKGIKIFYDGSLGSETAYLSEDYLTTPGNRGKTLWDLKDVESMLVQTWEQKLEFSVHTIGDQAAHDIVDLARNVSAKGHVGRLNLEHGELIRPETIQMMKPLHIRIHMQPCHWLSDNPWLTKKVGILSLYAFPWRALEAAQIPMSFGCDSPVESTSFVKNLQAISESSKKGIKPFKKNIEEYHSHPDSKFLDSYTVFEDNFLKEIHFNGRRII